MNKTITCRYIHSVAIKDDGTLECWGNNRFNRFDPVYKSFTSVISIASGLYHSVSLRNDGTIECWDIIDGINVIPFIKRLHA